MRKINEIAIKIKSALQNSPKKFQMLTTKPLTGDWKASLCHRILKEGKLKGQALI